MPVPVGIEACQSPLLSGYHCSPERLEHYLWIRQEVWERCNRKHPPGSSGGQGTFP